MSKSSREPDLVAEPPHGWGELNEWGLDVGDMTQIDDNLTLSREERFRQAAAAARNLERFARNARRFFPRACSAYD